jgi:PKD repeat protein
MLNTNLKMTLSFCFSTSALKRIFVLAGIFSLPALFAQNNERWLQLWQTPGTNYYTIKNAFDSAWHDKEAEMLAERRNQSANRNSQENEELDGTYFQFKRWQYFMEPRISATGDMSGPGTTYQKFTEYLNSNPAAMAQEQNSIARHAATNAWSFIGPVGAPQGGGAGRLCCIRFDPNNTDIIYAGTPSGGLWKTIDGGVSWNCLTDFLPAIGCSDVAVDPTNSQIVYLASGDKDGGDSPSIGVFKSIDGGLTWNPTGLQFASNAYRRIGKLLINPQNPNILYAGTSGGIYKTMDGGINWYLMTQMNTMDLAFKPGDPNTIYACKIGFYKSTNGGLTWTQIATGLPQTNMTSRMAIAVCPAAPNNVYVVASHTTSEAFEGVYVSTNDGNTFTPKSGSPNLLGWASDGSDNTGQGWYGIAIAVAPYNPNTVIVGGVNIWRSDDMGVNWALNAHWTGSGAPYVHADVHDLIFKPGFNGNYYAGCDGGIFNTSNDGGNFSDLSANMCIAQMYRGGVSGSTPGTVISGHQDNGTNIKVGTGYWEGLGGDGMDCFIDRTSDNNMFGELYYGDFYKSTNAGANFSGASNGTPGNGNWVTPWEQDPVNPTTLYAGFDQLYKSTNLGGSWNVVGTTVFGNLSDIEIAKSNPNYIYVTTGTTIWRSTDAGMNWTVINGNINTSGSPISRIAVSSYDENKVWITLSGYTVNQKVYFSTNGGTTWTNISYGLPNLPANCVVAVPGTSSDAVYVGMDVGVYYRDNSSATWQPYFTNLPNVKVDDLDIFLPTMKLTASTYGRGMWECAIDQSVLAPLANFSATPVSVCVNGSTQFTDLSTFNPTSWSWSFPGGNPSSSSAQSPIVTYNNPGTYPVTLVATNAAGSGTTTRTSYITVGGAQTLPYVEGFIPNVFLPSGWTGVNVGNQSAYWNRSAVTGHNSSESAYFNNLSYNIPTERDEMRTMGINFSGYTSLTFTFDVAYAKYSSSRSDTLEILASTDCGATWTTVYLKGGSNLSTVSSQNNAFTPTNSQWRNDAVNITAYAGQPDMIFSFKNHNHHGNYLWIDNINISGTVNAPPVAAFTTAGNVCMNNTMAFNDISSPSATSWSWTFPGGNPSSSSAQNPTVNFSTAGTYTVSLVSTNAFGNDSTSQVITVLPSPTANAGVDTSFCSTTYVQLNASGGVAYNWSPSTGMSNALIASPGIYMTASATFSVTVTDINGCSAIDSVHVTILPLPGFSVVANPTSMCLGDTASLICNNPAWTYSWTPASTLNIATGDSVIATPTSTTTYSITAVDTNGCVSNTTKAITVYPPLAPPVVLINGFTLTCSTFGFSYQWFLNGNPIAGATSQTYVATQVGNYSVIAYTYQGCDSGESPAVFVDGIKEEEGMSFTIAPNPNNGSFELFFNTTTVSDFSVNIYSVDGKLVYIEQLSHFSGTYRKQIDLSGFGGGTYIIRLSNDKQQSVQRIIVF